MPHQWYYKRGPQEIGPIPASELKAAAAAGRLRPDDLVRPDGTADWIPAGKVRGLFASPTPQPPPLPVRAKSAPPPLPPAASQQPPPLPVARPVVPLDALRGRLTAYANAVPHHGIKDFGGEIEVTGSSVLTVHRIELATLFEQRVVEERERPHDGGPAPAVASVTPDAFDPWQVSLPPPEFAAGSHEFVVPGSESARTCAACGADGEVGCPACGGEAEAACPACGGDGLVRCGSCLGRRRVENKVPQAGRRACHCVSGGYSPDPNTNGGCHRCRNTGIENYTYYASEWVQCLACQATGRQTCGGCRGHGRVSCPACGGQGVVGCETCAGSGAVVHALAVVRTLAPVQSFDNALPNDCPAGAADLLDPDTDFRQRHARTALGTLVAVDDWRLPPTAEGAVATLRSEAASRATPDLRPAGERVRVLTAPVYRLDYTFGGRRYAAWLPGEGRSVYAPASPLTERAAGLLDDAETAWATGDRRATLRFLRMALDMGKKCEQCQKAVGRRRSAIPDDLFDEAGKFDLLHWLGNLFR